MVFLKMRRTDLAQENKRFVVLMLNSLESAVAAPWQNDKLSAAK